MIRFALFGAGFIGQVHGANIAACPRTKLQYVYDVNVEAANKLAGRFGAKVAGSVEEIFAAADVDAVLIASSTTGFTSVHFGGTEFQPGRLVGGCRRPSSGPGWRGSRGCAPSPSTPCRSRQSQVLLSCLTSPDLFG